MELLSVIVCTAENIVGIYVELAILALQVIDGIATIFSSWFVSSSLLAYAQ